MPEVSDSKEYARVIQFLWERFEGFKIVPKENSRLMKIIDLVLKVITFGMMRDFMNSYTTTIGYVVYTPRSWSSQSYLAKAATLRHEGVHMRQRRTFGFFLFSLAYLFLPFPIIVAFCRREFEQEAYEETLRAYVDYYGIEMARDASVRSRIIGHFMGAGYFWTWPFRKNLESWYDEFVASLES